MFTLTSSISAKIIAAFGVIFLIVLALGGLAIERLGMINDLTIATRDNWLPSSQALGQLRSTIRLYRLAEARLRSLKAVRMSHPTRRRWTRLLTRSRRHVQFLNRLSTRGQTRSA